MESLTCSRNCAECTLNCRYSRILPSERITHTLANGEVAGSHIDDFHCNTFIINTNTTKKWLKYQDHQKSLQLALMVAPPVYQTDHQWASWNKNMATAAPPTSPIQLLTNILEFDTNTNCPPKWIKACCNTPHGTLCASVNNVIIPWFDDTHTKIHKDLLWLAFKQ